MDEPESGCRELGSLVGITSTVLLRRKEERREGEREERKEGKGKEGRKEKKAKKDRTASQGRLK